MADSSNKSPIKDSRVLGTISLALAVVLFLAINVFTETAIKGVQFDLTEKSLYTLSDGTKETLAAVKEPITLRFFSTRQLTESTPGLTAYGERVQELLERYVALSNNLVKLELVDPEPFSPEEDRAVGFGLSGVPITEAGDLGYFGLAATNTTDDTDVIPFLTPQREQFLEYDLTRMINNLANPKKKVIALISGIPVDSDPLKKYKAWALIDQLRQFFEVRPQGLTPKITDDVDLLMIVHPFGLSDESKYAIDQYVLAGGKAMIFVDPHAEEGARSNQALRLPAGLGSHMPKLFKAWGIKFDRDKVLGDLKAGQRVQAGVDSFGRPIITRYVAWTTYGPENINSSDVTTSQLRLVNFGTPGYFEIEEAATTMVEPLITSTEASGPFDAESVRRNPQPAEILKEFRPQNKTYLLAARVSGNVKSAFPDGPPKKNVKKDDDKKKDAATPKPHLKESVKPINLIAVADTDFMADLFWVQTQDLFGQQVVVPTANNADFIVNAADNLSGTSSLINLRSRGLSARPFELVQNIQNEAEDKYRAKERSLVKELEDVEKKMQELQNRERAKSAAVLSPEQQAEIAKFRARVLEIRQELRQVQLNLRRDIDNLDARLKVLNIAAVPAAVAILALLVAFVRRNRTRGRAAA
ncbi:MAG: ABC transporter [Rhodospirillaceae bacterium TMED63]|nr:MAG: ABC transporter [Rhodospirillaceae bacterium TMED63]